MNIRGIWLASALALLASLAQAQDPKANETKAGASQAEQPALPAPTLDWIPGPVADSKQPAPGRVAARNIGLAFTLPESWRADDVRWRELPAEEAKQISPMAEYGLVVELAGGGELRPLLTLYRVNLEDWRAADRGGTAGPGRIVLTTPDKGFVVVRPPEADKPGRYADLRVVVEDAIGTLGLFDAHHDERHLRPEVSGDFAGKLASGDAVALNLGAAGKLTLTLGAGRTLNGRWLQRDSQVIGQLLDAGEGVHPALMLHFDGGALVAVKWDEKLFGNAGVRLERAQ